MYKRTPEHNRNIGLALKGRPKPEGFGKKGASSPVWKGDKVGYTALHDWIRRTCGNAYRCEAKDCPGRSAVYDWANISGEYKRDVKDFIMLCRSCHKLFDNHKRTKVDEYFGRQE